jgi:TP901 family phage tail tape measure protein
MLQRSSSAMAEANNSLDETIALETAAVEITRDAASVGTAYKTVAMRIRGYDEETQAYTNDVEELSGKIADLTKTAEKPGGISLFKDEAKTEFKSTYELLDEISQIYDDLSDKNQAQLLEALAGKRQGQIVAATINNFDAARKAMDEMSNSAGSADREMGIIQQSVEYKINAMKETFVGIGQNLFKREDMGIAVSGLTKILEVIDALTEKLGLFGTIGAGAGIAAFVKNFD